MFRKIWALLWAFSLLSVAAGCGDDDDDASASATDTAEATEVSAEDAATEETMGDEEMGDEDHSEDEMEAVGDAAYPITVIHDAGETEIPAQPVRVVATSVSLVGTLLAMDVPLVAAAATSVNPLTDDKGFFSQWAPIADERGVEVAYSNLELDLEAIELYEPDLIIGSTIGGDSTLEAYEQLSEIAPTILYDYGSASWDELAIRIGEATGLEAEAEAAIADFDAYVADGAAQITLPDAQPVSLIVYQGADDLAVFNSGSPQGQIFTALGFDYAEGPDDIAAQVRSDASFYSQENMAAAIADTETLFSVPLGGPAAEAVLDDPLLSTVPAVANGNVFDVLASSFRLDPYSSRLLVDLLVETYGG